MSKYLNFFPPHLRNSLKLKIEEFCKAEGITKGDFAARSDMRPSSLSHIISGERPPTHQQLISIAKTLGTTSELLLDDLLTNFHFLPSAVLPQDINHILQISDLFMETLTPYEKVYCYLQCAHHLNAFRAMYPNGISEAELSLMFPRFLN